MRINHNIAALNTYRQLSANTTNTSKSLEKLSSGLRINRAGDDAAGLAISEKMRGQIRGLDQAARNANDGISLIQTAEGALNETHSILQRMRELAVQAANDTNTESDRAEIQKEINQLTSEINRISMDTEFNQKKLLDGSMASTISGANFEDSDGDPATGITVGLSAGASLKTGNYTIEITKEAGGGSGIAIATPANYAGTYTGTATFDGTVWTQDAAGGGGAAGDTIDLTALGITGAVDGDQINLTAAGSSTAEATIEVANGITAVDDSGTPTVAAGTYTLVYDGDLDARWEIGGAAATLSDYGIAGLTGVPTEGSELSVVITAGAAANATVVPAAGSGPTITVTVEDEAGQAVADSNFTFEYDPALAADTYTATVSVNSNSAMIFHIGANNGQNTSLSIGNMNAESLGINAIDLRTQVSADAAIGTIDAAISTVSSQRAALGGMQNRLEHTINNLGTTSENLAASESRIRDVDMAKEMMEFTKNNILSQASQAMLAQANMQPQSVLQLLQ